MNPINRSATRSKALHGGLNQGIDLGDIKSRIGSIQFKIGFHHQDCLHTILVYFNRRPDAFDIGILNRHGVHSLLSAEHTTAWPGSGAPILDSGCRSLTTWRGRFHDRRSLLVRRPYRMGFDRIRLPTRSRGTLRSSVWLHKRAQAGARRPPERHVTAASYRLGTV